jgi:hypothetical protein
VLHSISSLQTAGNAKSEVQSKQRSGLKSPAIDKVDKTMPESLSRLKQEIESNDATKVAAL